MKAKKIKRYMVATTKDIKDIFYLFTESSKEKAIEAKCKSSLKEITLTIKPVKEK